MCDRSGWARESAAAAASAASRMLIVALALGTGRPCAAPSASSQPVTRGAVAMALGQQLVQRRSAVWFAAIGLCCVPTHKAEGFVAGEDEETSGLVVLRVAEVCDFQEKLLRTIEKCSSPNSKELVDQFGLPCAAPSACNTGHRLRHRGR